MADGNISSNRFRRFRLVTEGHEYEGQSGIPGCPFVCTAITHEEGPAGLAARSGDLLERLGFAPPWRETADGDRIVPEQRYRLDAEVGPVATPSGAVAGRALLALADDRMPEPSDLRALRDALRGLIASHLDGRELVSWGVLAKLPSTESGGQARRSISDDPSDQ